MAQHLQICNVQLRLSGGFLNIFVQAQPFLDGIESLLVNPTDAWFSMCVYLLTGGLFL